jgi:hypothetical protein
MCETVGLYVERLIRLAIGGLRLPRALRPGEWRDVTPDELRALSRDSRSDESDDDSTTDSGTAENQHETVDGPWTDHV